MKQATISDLFQSAVTLTNVAERSEDYCVRCELASTDKFTVQVLLKRKSYTSVFYGTVENVSHNIIDGYLLVGEAIGFMDGRDKAREVDFTTGKPLEDE